MLNHIDKIKKLNVLEKLLRQDFISVRKNLGDEKIVKEVNDDIKEFLNQSMERIFAGAPSPNQQTFSENQVMALTQLADRLLTKAQPKEEKTPIHGDPPPPPNARRKKSPVAEAFEQAGFDPNASIEDRKAAVKRMAKTKKGKK